MDPRDLVDLTPAQKAAAGDVPPELVHAEVTPEGDVLIYVDSHTARTLALGWALLHTTDETHNAQRPRWHDDCVHILTAAAHADVDAGRPNVHRTHPFTAIPGGAH